MRLRTLNRYIVTSVMRTGILTSLLACFMLMGVDLFRNLDTYINHSVGFTGALRLTILYFPEAFLLALSPAFLFAVTYHLSMLSADNEMISILNAGISFTKVIRPIFVCALLISALFFAFNEKVAIPSSNTKDVQYRQMTDSNLGSNNTDVALSDTQRGYMVYAGMYSDPDQSLFDVSLVESLPDGTLIRRTDAYKARYSMETGLWTFTDAYVYTPEENGVDVAYIDSFESQILLLEPQLFRNSSNEISKMPLGLAGAYLARMKALNPEQYAILGTDYYQRVFSCLTPLIMMIIACSMDYKFKRNVLFFSLICSIAVAVVYYVVQMMTTMLASQGVIAPYLGSLVPFAVIIAITSVLGAVLRRQ